MRAILSRQGCSLNYKNFIDMVGMEGYKIVKKAYTKTTPIFGGGYKSVTRVRRSGTDIIFPRFSCGKLKQYKVISELQTTLPTGNPIFTDDSVFNLVPSPNQITVHAHLMDTVFDAMSDSKQFAGLSAKCNSCILQMDPGYGKTYLSMDIIKSLNTKTMVIVPNGYLLNQWVKVLEAVFPDLTIGTYYGKRKRDGDIIVAIINSALKYPSYDDIGLVIFDEVHMYCTNARAKIFGMAQAKYCLGITATPTERLDAFDVVSTWELGKVIYAADIPGWDPNSVSYNTEVYKVQYRGSDEYTQVITNVAGVLSVPLMLNQLAEDPERNAVIVEQVRKMYELGNNIFIFSDRLSQLETIRDLLVNSTIRNSEEGKTNGNIILSDVYAPELVTKMSGGATEDEIRVATNSRIILTTYMYSGTGVSIDKMDSIVLATPRKSNMKQILGRIYRLGGDSTCVRRIVDIVDMKTAMKSQYYGRNKVYRQMSGLIYK